MVNRLFLLISLVIVALPAYACPGNANQKSSHYHGSCGDKHASIAEKKTECAKVDSKNDDEARAMIAPKALEQSETTKSTRRVPLSRSGGSASTSYVKMPSR